MQVYDIALKLFVEAKDALEPKALIPIFHRFIQTHALDELLIDVADYSHVQDGPGVVLICHGAIYGLDDEDGRRGLSYRRRRDSGGTFHDKLLGVARGVLVAADKLERELPGRLRFSTSELELAVADRLRAPNTVDTYTQARPDIERLAVRLFGEGAFTLEHVLDPRRRFTVRLRAKNAPPLATMLGRLANEAPRA